MMFGKKKELELRGRINTILDKVNEKRNTLEVINKENINGEEELGNRLRTTIDCDENIKRDMAYIGIISEEAIKEIEIQSALIEAQSNKSKELTEAVRDKDVFDTEKISRSTNKILESVKNDDRLLSGIREEMRGLEVIGVSLKDFANQTSALSLNAAIMGARLENGNEGFVQTATEIKELASECVKTIAEFNRRLEAIQNNLNELDKEGQVLRDAVVDSNTAAEAISKSYGDIQAKFLDEDDEKGASLDDVGSKLQEIGKAISELKDSQEEKLEGMVELLTVNELQLERGKALENVILDIDSIF